MLINVKMINGSVFPIEVSEEGTVKEIKEMMVDKCGWEPENQKLIYLGRILQDEQTCRNANLNDGVAIHLIHKPRPVDPPTNPAGDNSMDVDHDHDLHGIHIETSPDMFGFHATPTNVNPTQRLQVLSRVADRLGAQRVPRFESAYAHRELAEPTEVFELESDVHMDDSSHSSDDSDSEPHPEGQNSESGVPLRREESAGASGTTESNRAPFRQYRSVVVQVLGLTERILPFADILSQAVVSRRSFTPRGAQFFQTAFDSLNMSLHDLAHLFHGLSDMNVDFQKPVHERALTISPRIQVEHRALLSTAITIPMTAVGVPNIGNLIAQQLNQIPGMGMGTPFQPHGPQPNSQVNGQNVTTHGIRTNNVQAVINPSANTSSGSAQNQGQQDDPVVRAMSQSIADRISSIVGQIENGNQPRGNGNTPETSDLSMILPCSSPLNRNYLNPSPVVPADAVGHFKTRFISPMEFASDLLSLAAHPLALKVLQYIHNNEPAPTGGLDNEQLLAKHIARDLLFQDGRSVVYGLLYAADNINYVPATPDLKIKLENTLATCLRQMKASLLSGPHTKRPFGLMEIFHVIVPAIVQDLKCFYSNDRWQGKWYIRALLDQVFPKEADGTKMLFEEEFMKYYEKADSRLSKYFGKLRVGPLANIASPCPEDLPDD